MAGTFQNYDEFGLYRSDDGEDSLPYRYKYVDQKRSLGRKVLSDQRSTVTFRGQLPDLEGEEQRIRFGHADVTKDEWLYLSKLSVFDADGRLAFEADADSFYFACGSNCRHENGYAALRATAKMYVYPRLDEGEYSFELTAWAQAEGTLVEATSLFRFWRHGDTWFHDMRKAGFDGAVAPAAVDSLEWLGRRIAEDRRFAEATVKFWWPAIMGREVVRPPTDRNDADFEIRLLEAQAQGAEVDRLARMFRNGRRDDEPYDLKDLLVELVLSKWFRAARITDADQVRRAALQSAGATRPLTPEELVAKTEALTGYVWGRKRLTYGPKRDRPRGHLQDLYAPLYGGIDSEDVTERSRRFTAPAAQVAKLHANTITTPVAIREFLLLPDEQRRLFSGIGLSDTPETASDAIRAKLAELQEMFFGVRAGAKGVQDAYRFFEDAWRNSATMYPHLARSLTDTLGRLNDYYLWECSVVNGGRTDDCYLEGIRDDALVEWGAYSFTWSREVVRELGDGIDVTEEEMRMAMTWSTMLAAMFMDYRYLHL